MTDLTPSALSLAIRFHETYERLAPSFGYETRTDTRQFDPTSKNGRLMVAVCGELAGLVSTPPPAPEVSVDPAVIMRKVREVRGFTSERRNETVRATTVHSVESGITWDQLVTLCDACDAATQRAEAAERELDISRAETENVRTNLICVMDERGAAEQERDTVQGALYIANTRLEEARDTLVHLQKGMAAEGALRRQRAAPAPQATPTPPAAPCEMCGGRGEVGGHEPDGSWDTRPCPGCAPPAAPSEQSSKGLCACHECGPPGCRGAKECAAAGYQCREAMQAAPSELAKELTDEDIFKVWEREECKASYCADYRIGFRDGHRFALSAPGSEAPEIVAYRVRFPAAHDGAQLLRAYYDADERDEAYAALERNGGDITPLTPLPASPASNEVSHD